MTSKPSELGRRHKPAAERRARMSSVHQLMILLSPRGQDPEAMADVYWADWSEEDFPKGRIKLTPEALADCAAVLNILVRRFKVKRDGSAVR